MELKMLIDVLMGLSFFLMFIGALLFIMHKAK